MKKIFLLLTLSLMIVSCKEDERPKELTNFYNRISELTGENYSSVKIYFVDDVNHSSVQEEAYTANGVTPRKFYYYVDGSNWVGVINPTEFRTLNGPEREQYIFGLLTFIRTQSMNDNPVNFTWEEYRATCDVSPCYREILSDATDTVITQDGYNSKPYRNNSIKNQPMISLSN